MSRAKKIIVAVIAVPVLAFSAVWLVGASVSETHTANVEGDFAIEPAALFAIIADIESYSAWRGGTSAVKRLADRDGRAVFEETTDFGPIRYEVVESTAPTRLVTRIVDNEDFGGTWTWVLSRHDGGTRVTITEDGEIYSKFFRFVSRFVMGYDATMKQYLADLRKKVS